MSSRVDTQTSYTEPANTRSGEITTNTMESSFALIKRGIIGTYHNVSREYLHRYLWQFDFVWNGRKLNDGERTVAAIQAAEGKRLMYKSAVPPIMPKTAKKTPEIQRGPKPDLLKIDGDWKDAVKKSLAKKKPAVGWPKEKPL